MAKSNVMSTETLVRDLYVNQRLSQSRTLLRLREHGVFISNHSLREILQQMNVLRSTQEAMRLTVEQTNYANREYKPVQCEACRASFAPRIHHVKTCYVCCPTALDRQRWRFYKITKQAYDALWKRAGGACEACNAKLERSQACIDHDHQTMRVRGILCHVCNRALGHFEKHRESFDRYLKRSEPVQASDQ